MNLNLTTGRNLPALKKRIKLPQWVLNEAEYTRRPGRLISRIIERFQSVYGDCFVPYDFRIKYLPNGRVSCSFADVYDTEWLAPEAKQEPVAQVNECLTKSRTVKLIALPIHLIDTREAKEISHAQLLIINKVNFTVELYDSNGSEHIPPNHMETIQLIFEKIKWPLSKYTFVPVNESNPPNGLQVFQTLGTEPCYSIGGFCAIWMFYYAELRAQQVNDTALTFKNKLTRRLRKLAEAGISLSKYFRDIILDYLVEIGRL